MDKKKDDKQVELKYEFDRLGFKKLSLVYRLLIPLSADAGDDSMVQTNNEHETIRVHSDQLKEVQVVDSHVIILPEKTGKKDAKGRGNSVRK